MAKINYRVCDACGSSITIMGKHSRRITGYSILNRLFRKIDICDECLRKLRMLSIDKEDELKYLKQIKYDHGYDLPCESAYLQGWDDALKVLSHHRLRDIKK